MVLETSGYTLPWVDLSFGRFGWSGTSLVIRISPVWKTGIFTVDLSNLTFWANVIRFFNCNQNGNSAKKIEGIWNEIETLLSAKSPLRTIFYTFITKRWTFNSFHSFKFTFPAFNFSVCTDGDFRCISHPHTCIKLGRICDNIYDCVDHTDELNCEEYRSLRSQLND